ncbi:MAG: hypothetical protein J2P24_14420 [Streptosporangiales bacterium]|nr:hypothetical protein [Streptosporangiales bacterium]
MADPSDVRPARDGAFTDRAAKRRSEPAHAVGGAAGSVLSTGRNLPDRAVPTLTVTAPPRGRRGREAGPQEGRRQGPAPTREARRERTSGRHGSQPVNRDRGAR